MSKPWEEEKIVDTATGSITEEIAAAIGGIADFFSKLFQLLFSVLFDPKSLFVFWALFLYFALSTVSYNYENTRPAVENYKAWGLWFSSVLVSIVLIYRPTSDLLPENGAPSSGSPPPRKSWAGLIALCISMVLLVAVFIYSLQYYYRDENFNSYKSHIEQLDCNHRILNFTKDNATTDEHSQKQYFSKLSDIVGKGEQKPYCHITQESSPTLEFWQWFQWSFWVGDYYDAKGVAAVVMDDNAIEANATWIAIYSPWYKYGTRSSTIKATVKGRVACDYSESTKTLAALLNIDQTNETPNDGHFLAEANLKGISTGERVQAEGQALLSIRQFERSSTTFGPGWLGTGLAPSRSSQTTKSPFSYTFLCKQNPLHKKPQLSQKKAKP